MSTKFSQFAYGGNLDASDYPVGLKNADNAQFTYAPGIVEVWIPVAVDTVMTGGNGYYTTGGGTLNLTLPAIMAPGAILGIAGFGSTGWKLVQNAGQQIFFEGVNTTLGAGGYLQSTVAKDGVQMLCVVANLTFLVLSSEGNITYV